MFKKSQTRWVLCLRRSSFTSIIVSQQFHVADMTKERSIGMLRMLTVLGAVASLTLSALSLWFTYLSWTQRHPHARELPRS